MFRLVRFEEDCGRMGSLESLFVASEMDWVAMHEYGKDLLFYEVLGKHSQIYVTLGESNLTVLSDDQDFIKKFIEIMGYHISGIDILNMIYEDMSEETYEALRRKHS